MLALGVDGEVVLMAKLKKYGGKMEVLERRWNGVILL
jgi:hypothetical protein